jgi:hypothetical protein
VARPCTVCKHPKRKAIDADLASLGVSLRAIASRYDIDKTTVMRHRDGCLGRAIQAAIASREVVRQAETGETALQRVENLTTDALTILREAKEAGKPAMALAAIDRALSCVNLIAKLTGELDERPTTNVLVTSPEWLAVQGRLIAALRPFPDAAAAVRAALDGVGPPGGIAA